MSILSYQAFTRLQTAHHTQGSSDAEHNSTRQCRHKQHSNRQYSKENPVHCIQDGMRNNVCHQVCLTFVTDDTLSPAVCAGDTQFDEEVVGTAGAGYRWQPPGDHLRFSIAPPDYAATAAAAEALDGASSEAGSCATVADLVTTHVSSGYVASNPRMKSYRSFIEQFQNRQGQTRMRKLDLHAIGNCLMFE